MNIAIRMDDITPDMDWAKFLRFKELCDLYQVKPLIGVVPQNMDENLHIDEPKEAPVKDFWGYVKDLQNRLRKTSPVYHSPQSQADKRYIYVHITPPI